jgi:iron(III) transport system substrate-binding protein
VSLTTVAATRGHALKNELSRRKAHLLRRILAFAAPIFVVVAIVAVIAAVEGSRNSQAADTLTVYSGQHPQTVAALVAAFEKKSGISVAVRSDDEGVLESQIVTEGNHSPADVFLTENSPPLEALAGKGMLAKIDPAILAKTSAKYSSPTGNWAGISARVSTMVYNTNKLTPSQLPGSIMELASPKWRGKLALAPTETDFQPVVTAVAARYGQARALKWLEAIRANAAGHIYPDNETLVRAVNSGQAALGVINHYYWYRLRDEIGPKNIHSAEHFFRAGDPGYVIDVSGAGVLASSSHKSAAQQFVAFLVSRAGQQILAHDQSYEYPLGSGVVTAQPLFPFSMLRPDPITVGRLGDGSTALKLLRQASLL